MTQSDLANGHFSVSYVSAVERGLILPSLGALNMLSEALKTSVTVLLSDDQAGRDDRDGALRGESGRRDATRSEDTVPQELFDLLLEAEYRLAGARLEDVQVAFRALTDACDRATLPYDKAHVCWRRAEAAWLLGELALARAAAHEALLHAEGAHDALLMGRVRVLLARLYDAAGDLPLALAHATIGLRALEGSDLRDPMLSIEALGLFGSLARRSGRLEDGLQALALATAEERLGDATPGALAQAYARLSWRYAHKGTPLAARYYLLRAIATREQAAVATLVATIADVGRGARSEVASLTSPA
jgi:transcriptional regulator with XRE-family HTH domain